MCSYTNTTVRLCTATNAWGPCTRLSLSLPTKEEHEWPSKYTGKWFLTHLTEFILINAFSGKQIIILLYKRFTMAQGPRNEAGVGDSKIENYHPNTRAMKAWKKRVYVDEEPIIEKKKDEETPIQDVFPANKNFTTFFLVLITMSVGGSIFAMIGYSVGPKTCDNDSIFEILGVFAFWMSMLGIPVNIIILLSSLTDAEFDSKNVFTLIIVHIGITLICGIVFIEFIFQDLFCNGGPDFYVTASPI